MALLETRKEKSVSSGAYDRVLGNKELGRLISMAHATSISNGSELEKLILRKSKNVVENPNELESILHKRFDGDWDVIIVPKNVIKKSSIKKSREPDFLVIQKSNETLNIIKSLPHKLTIQTS